MSSSRPRRITFLLTLIAVALLELLSLVGVVDIRAFSLVFSDHFSGSMGAWERYKIGDCSGQRWSVSGSLVRQEAQDGTDCVGAYYRDNNERPGTFPTADDVRVTWRFRYPQIAHYGTQAGQVTSAYGVTQYYGMSAVESDDVHVLTDGPWGRRDVNNPLWRSRTTDWHTATFDWVCDGTQMKWWMDSSKVYQVNNAAYYRPPGDPYRPYQFWFGNLLTDVGSNDDWTHFHIDYVHIFKVERPHLNTPAAGSGGSQPVS